MSNVIKILLLAVGIVLSSGTAQAQSVDEIIDKHLGAVGGREALQKIQSRTSTGNLSVATANGTFAGTITRYDKLPNKSRVMMKLDLSVVGAGELSRDQRFDGTTGVVIDSMKGESEISGVMLENMRNGSFPNLYLRYKERGVTVELIGKEKIDGKDLFVVAYKPKTGSPSKHYFDAGTFLLVKVVAKLNIPPAEEMEQTTEFLDYREVDGVKIPFQVKQTSAAQALSITFTKIEQNTAIDEALFQKPVAEKK